MSADSLIVAYADRFLVLNREARDGGKMTAAPQVPLSINMDATAEVVEIPFTESILIEDMVTAFPKGEKSVSCRPEEQVALWCLTDGTDTWMAVVREGVAYEIVMLVVIA
jgi:hypothetical protein